jgi:hypothetical protein
MLTLPYTNWGNRIGILTMTYYKMNAYNSFSCFGIGHSASAVATAKAASGIDQWMLRDANARSAFYYYNNSHNLEMQAGVVESRDYLRLHLNLLLWL